MDVRIEKTWHQVLCEEFKKSYFAQLVAFVRQEYTTKTIYPPAKEIFNAFDSCPFDQAKVVIIGQDPYHEPQQAHGLCFSVRDNVDIPPSLQNIYKELESDLGIAPSPSGCLQRWAEQGVLLLNATLTVCAHQDGSHQGKGWETFTDNVILTVSEQKENIVFILWGSYAQQKIKLIDTTKHCVLTAVHPSPLSAYMGFFGCQHFSQANTFLANHGLKEIDWR